MIDGIISDFKMIREDRIIARRKIFKFLKENIYILPMNNFERHRFLRKMDMKWLGDYSDKKLIEIVTEVKRRLKN